MGAWVLGRQKAYGATVKQSEPASLDLAIALDIAQKRRVEYRDMLAVWLLCRQREGVKVVNFNDPQLSALMKLCADAEEAVVQAAARMIREQP